MMKSKPIVVFFLLATILTPAGQAHGKLRVAATVPDLAAVAREIGGEAVEVTSLSSHNQDPHFADPKPSLVLRVNRADLLLMVGLDLEIGWLPTLITQSRNPRIQVGSAGHLDCSQFVEVLETPATKVDRSMGDIHPGGNPHYFHDPRAMLAVARGMAARLSEIDPAGASAYRKGLEAFARRTEAARRDWERRLAPFRGIPVISYHKSWSYLFDWLGLRAAGYIEPKPGIPPSPSHVAELVGRGRREGMRVIVRENFQQDATTRVLAGQLAAEVVDLPAGSDLDAGQSYVDRIARVIDALEAALQATAKAGS